jgi:hypothetical protein
MGLTIHYELSVKTESQVRRTLAALHRAALDLPFHQVGEIKQFEGDAANFQKYEQDSVERWFLIQADGNISVGKNERGWDSSQYASDPRVGGLPHFLRCHLAVVALLDEAKKLGCLSSVSDEGGFWEKRSVEALGKETGQWNEMIAAGLGVLQGIAESDGSKLEAPILGFPNFERLEAAGHENLPDILKSLSQIEPKDQR